MARDYIDSASARSSELVNCVPLRELEMLLL